MKTTNRRNIILDTDIGPDCDDAAAIAILNIYENKGLCKILGIGHCTSNPYGAGTIDAICGYYGHKNVNIGSYSGKGFLCSSNCMRYNKHITERFPNRYKESQPEDAVKMYRRLLSEQADGDVYFAAIGPLNNLSDLLKSGPDEYSDMTGTDLVEKKVKKLTLMAGAFPCASKSIRRKAELVCCCPIAKIREFNVICDIGASRNVAENWNSEKVYLGYEAGLVETCGPLQQRLDDSNPVKIAYKLYTKNGSRYSWDLFTVQYTACAGCENYTVSEPGTVRFDSRGRTLWKPDENGRDRYIELNKPLDEIKENINSLLTEK